MKIFLNQAWLQIQVRKKKNMQRIWHNRKINVYQISFFLGLDPYSARSCDLGQLTCHGSATCEDHSNGFCCKCINGWYGDGSTCLPKVLFRLGFDGDLIFANVQSFWIPNWCFGNLISFCDCQNVLDVFQKRKKVAFGPVEKYFSIPKMKLDFQNSLDNIINQEAS
jgi:hypothetical protein